MEIKKNTNFPVLIIGGIIGAFLGIVAAYIMVNSEEVGKHGGKIDPKKSMRLGVSIVSLLRSFNNLRSER